MIGSSARGTTATMIRVSLRLVMSIMMSAPVSVRALRRAMLIDEPMMVCSTVVSP
jgi:hypothetical protein